MSTRYVDFKSAQHIYQFIPLDFRIISGGSPCIPGGKTTLGPTLESFRKFDDLDGESGILHWGTKPGVNKEA